MPEGSWSGFASSPFAYATVIPVSPERTAALSVRSTFVESALRNATDDTVTAGVRATVNRFAAGAVAVFSFWLNDSVSFVPSTSAPVTAGGGVRLPSTLCPGSPVVGRPDTVSVALLPSASLIVAVPARKITASSVADAVWIHAPSASMSAATTVCSKRTVLPEWLWYNTSFRLLVRSASSVLRSSRSSTFLS